MKNKFFTKNESVWTCGAHLHLKGVYTPTHTHISENFAAPIRTKIATPAFVHVGPPAHTHTKWVQMMIICSFCVFLILFLL